MSNKNMNEQQRRKFDEFFTDIKDIERELLQEPYVEAFKGKTIYCNCDKPGVSGFWDFFIERLKCGAVKRVIATYMTHNGETSYKTEAVKSGGEIKETRTPLSSDGDFRSPECVEILKEADIICTNPPFSLWREYVQLLMDNDKKFVILGDHGAITYKAIFPLFRDEILSVNITGDEKGETRKFYVPDEYLFISSGRREKDSGKFYTLSGTSRWYNNLGISTHIEKMNLTQRYDPERYPKYDNWDAIEVSRIKNIPYDYAGVMGVPITLLERLNREQFEIVDISHAQLYLKGERKYKRLFIKNKTPGGASF